MNHIIKEIDYCADHAHYSPIKIYAGDVGIYNINCSACLNEVRKAAFTSNLSRPKKMTKPLKEVIKIEQVPTSPLK